MSYAVDPGLYALGHPNAESAVLVTANYKLTFDSVRSALAGRDLWILVLDTKGINVWCAAGKGTFGTQELVQRIRANGLEQVVNHGKLILPQLGAPGVAAHQVKKLAGFEVVYGPIQATDLPAFMDNGCKATSAMRRKGFPLRERAVLIPVEFVMAFKWFLVIALFFFVLGGLLGEGGFLASALDHGLFAVLALFGALVAGAVMTPLMLPWLPGRAFSLKGLWLGLIWSGILVALTYADLGRWKGQIGVLSWVLISPAIAAFLAMNFTGASTYTSLSGVRKEMKVAVPLQIVAASVGLCVWIGSLVLA
jgi:acetyl-CoA decarbonylase/synthase complex subunit gamma